MKKFNFKLTIILVSLFISMVLCGLSNINKYCLFFGLIMLGITSILFAWYKYEDVKKREDEANSVMEEVDPDDYVDIAKPIRKEKKKLLSSFIGLAIFLIIIAFISLYA